MRKSTIAGAVAAMALLLGACGGEEQKNGVASVNGDSAPSDGEGKNAAKEPSEEDFLESMRKYAGCMRENGIDMPDPDPNSGAMPAAPAVRPGEENSKLAKADEECRSLLPNGGEMGEISPEELDKMREQAKCLREHGIDVKDPTKENPGMGIPMEPDDEKFEKALEACGQAGGLAVTVG